MRTAAQGSLGSLKIVDGLVVNDRWFSPEEGPFTVLAKVARANVLSARQLCRHLGVSLPPAATTSSNARSLLHLGWMGRSKRSQQMFGMLWGRGLLAHSEHWTHALASDRALRYCPLCLAQGFQSAFCQVDGLERCPTHGEQLLDCCRACGASTPPYAITPEAFDEPMVCADCGHPFAPIWGRGGGRGLRQGIDGQPEYRQLCSWLARADRLDAEWPDRNGWLGISTSAALQAGAHKRRHVAAVLSSVIPAPGPPSKAQHWSASWPLLSRRPVHPIEGPSVMVKARIAIYKSIRRHASKRFGGVQEHAERSRDGESWLWTNDHAMVMPSGEGADPAVHGLLTWRLRFEEHPRAWGPGSRLALFNGLLYWPGSWAAPDAAWGHFVHRCLLLDQAMARGLARAMTGLNYWRSADRSTWMEVAGNWHHRFGSQARLWPDGLTVFRSDDSIQVVAAPSAVFTPEDLHGC